MMWNTVNLFFNLIDVSLYIYRSWSLASMRWSFRGSPYCSHDHPGVTGHPRMILTHQVSPITAVQRVPCPELCGNVRPAATSLPQPQIGPGRPKTAAGDASFSFFSESRQHSINFRARSRIESSAAASMTVIGGVCAKRWTLWNGGVYYYWGPAV